MPVAFCRIDCLGRATHPDDASVTTASGALLMQTRVCDGGSSVPVTIGVSLASSGRPRSVLGRKIKDVPAILGSHSGKNITKVTAISNGSGKGGRSNR